MKEDDDLVIGLNKTPLLVLFGGFFFKLDTFHTQKRSTKNKLDEKTRLCLYFQNMALEFFEVLLSWRNLQFKKKKSPSKARRGVVIYHQLIHTLNQLTNEHMVQVQTTLKIFEVAHRKSCASTVEETAKQTECTIQTPTSVDFQEKPI